MKSIFRAAFCGGSARARADNFEHVKSKEKTMQNSKVQMTQNFVHTFPITWIRYPQVILPIVQIFGKTKYGQSGIAGEQRHPFKMVLLYVNRITQ